MIGLRAVETRGEVTSSPSSRTVPLVDTRQVFEPFGRTAEGDQAIGNLFGERTGLRALACHVDWHVDRTVRQLAVGREDLGKTAVDIGNVAGQQRLNLRDIRTQ